MISDSYWRGQKEEKNKFKLEVQMRACTKSTSIIIVQKRFVSS